MLSNREIIRAPCIHSDSLHNCHRIRSHNRREQAKQRGLNRFAARRNSARLGPRTDEMNVIFIILFWIVEELVVHIDIEEGGGRVSCRIGDISSVLDGQHVCHDDGKVRCGTVSILIYLCYCRESAGL